MFDAVLHRNDLPKRRLGTGLFFSVACHGAVVVAILYASTHVARPLDHGREIVFFAAPPAPLSGANGASRAAQPARPEVPGPPKEAPHAEVKPAQPKPKKIEERGDVDGKLDAAAGAAHADGKASGAEGGVAGGVPGGTVGAAGEVLPFGEGMTPPTLLSGPAPAYTPEALAAGVQGTMVVKCVITTLGTLINCRVIKPLPFMEKPVLDALAQRRYMPVVFQGVPINVDYVIPIRLTLEAPPSLAQRK